MENCNKKWLKEALNERKLKAGLRKVPIPSIRADPSESQDCSGREQCMNMHTTASALGAFPFSYIAKLEARYFLPSSVSWPLLGHLCTSEDTSEVTGKDIKHIF